MVINNVGKIVVVGATGDLGTRIVKALIDRKAKVTAIVRPGCDATKLQALRNLGVETVEIEINNASKLHDTCLGASCVVSALAGLREVIIDTQKLVLDAAINSGVPRFIPSDYSIDFTKTPAGRNRNLDMRREFHQYLATAPILSTSVFNGAFTSLLTGQAPIILFKIKRILCWGDPDQKMDFTTIDDTAAYTAAVALDPSSPRQLHIAGDSLSPREMAETLSEVTGTKFNIMRVGGLNLLSMIINITRAIAPSTQQLYPAWQGMQYLRDMASGLARVDVLNNDRYPEIKWQSVKAVLTEYFDKSSKE